MRTSLRLSGFVAAALAAMTLAGCNDNSKNDDLLTSGTASEIAIRQIEHATCDEKTPQDLSNVVVRDSDDAVDVSRIEPDCS